MIEIRTQRRYRHRLATSGDAVHYVAVVAVKRTSEPAAALAAGL
jgi:hypothetical protein